MTLTKVLAYISAMICKNKSYDILRKGVVQDWIKKENLTFHLALIFLLNIVASLSSQAQLDFQAKKNYKMEDGLSSNRIYSIIQDSLGFMWFGTSNGLNRFDGLTFKNYYFDSENKNSISSNKIADLLVAKDNKLWIALDKGVDVYDPRYDSFTHLNLKTADGQSIKRGAYDIMQDSEGLIWIATIWEGLFCYNPVDNKLLSYKNNPKNEVSISQNRITTICEDSRGLIWVGTYSEGLCSFSKKTKKFTRYKKGLNNNSLLDNSIQKIYEDPHGYLWIGTYQNGLYRFDEGKKEFTHFFDGDQQYNLRSIHGILAYGPEEILVASDNGAKVFKTLEGKILFNEKTNNILPEVNKFIYSVYKDREGGIWLGSYFNGLQYIPPTQKNFKYYSFKSKSGTGLVINTVVQGSNGNYWIGTDDNGIHLFDSSKGAVKPFRTAFDISSSYYCIHDLIFEQGRLYAATYGRGLEIFDLTSGKIKSYLHDPKDRSSISSSRIFSLYKTKSGRIYIGTANGICYYNRDEDNFVRLKPEFLIQDIVEDEKNNIWIATADNGLIKYNPKSDSYKTYIYSSTNSKSIINNAISTLAVDSKGRLWVGSNGYGICRYDAQTDGFIRFPSLNLPNSVISKIIPAQRYLWIATNKGLVRWDEESDLTSLFSKSSGLYNEQFSSDAGLLSSSGQILLGSSDGLCVFSPHNLNTNEFQPSIVITELFTNNQRITPFTENSPLTHSIEITKEIILSYDQTSIGVEFSSLSYPDPNGNMYEYILEGLEDKWHSTSGQNRKISYNNLAPGRYILKIRGTNSDKIWSRNERELKIIIKPHFLLSNVALSSYILFFIFFLYFFIRYLVKRSERIHLAQIRLIEQATEKEIHDAKIDFFTNVAHEIRTPLSLIIGPLESIMKSDKKLDDYLDYLSVIEMNSKRLYALVTQLLDFRKVDSGHYRIQFSRINLSIFVQNVTDHFKLISKERQVVIDSDISSMNYDVILDVEAITKVLNNLISNALKYANERIEIYAVRDEKEFHIVVEDDGPGIPIHEREKVFSVFYRLNNPSPVLGVGLGLHMTKSLLQLMGGGIVILDRENNKPGTLLKISLPILNCSEYEIFQDVQKFLPAITETATFQELDDSLEHEVQDLEKPSILIVDDNQELLSFLNLSLKPSYFVHLANSASDAIQLLNKHHFDLILSDIMMSGMNGLEFCHFIKTNISTSHIPFVMLTAKADIESKINSLDYGSDAYIEKPFSPNYLKAQLRNLLKKRDELRKKFASTPLSEIRMTAHNRLDTEFIEKCNSIITENISSPDFSIEQLAREMALSRTSLFTKLKSITGMTPNDLIKVVRLKTASKLMIEGKYRVTEIGFLVGFNSSSYFAKCFLKQFGMLPNEYMKQFKDS